MCIYLSIDPRLKYGFETDMEGDDIDTAPRLSSLLTVAPVQNYTGSHRGERERERERARERQRVRERGIYIYRYNHRDYRGTSRGILGFS